MIWLFDVPFSDERVSVVTKTDGGVERSVDDRKSNYDEVVLACGASEPCRIGSVDAGGSGRRGAQSGGQSVEPCR